MFPRKLLLLIIDFLFKNKATVLAPAGSPISNTKIIDACIQKIGKFQSSHLYGNFLCPDLAHAAGDELIVRCMRESVETPPNTPKSSRPKR